uniref:DUF4455 domain-containing protein n=1 Tax=Buteo japonicus TaxID=224669 RepID=A0A8C0BKV2_9AVES
TEVLRKYTVILEEISFFLSADVYRFMNDEAMMINRALLANQRAIAKLFFNLMKSEMKTELSHRLKWQDRVKDWKYLLQCILQSYREFMASEEIQNPPTVKTEMENMIMDQILLSERRLEFLQHLGYDREQEQRKIEFFLELMRDLTTKCTLLPFSVQLYNAAIRQGLNVFYKALFNGKNAFLVFNRPVTLNRGVIEDFEELAKQNEQNCRNLYSYFKEAMDLWDVHQLKLSQQEGELQKKLDECRWKQNNSIQV